MSLFTPDSVLADESLINEYKWNRNSLIAFGEFMKSEALKAAKPIVIAIFYEDQRIYQIGLEGTSQENDDWVSRKVNSVLATGHASLYIRAQIEGEIANKLSIKNHLGDLAFCGGGIPILNQGKVVGVLVVSGLPHYEDHKFILDSFRAWSHKQ